MIRMSISAWHDNAGAFFESLSSIVIMTSRRQSAVATAANTWHFCSRLVQSGCLLTGIPVMTAIPGVLLAAAIFFVAQTGLTEEPAPEYNLAPIISRETMPDGSSRFRLLGPLYESRTAPDGSVFKAMRPVFTRKVEPDGMHFRTDVFWPVATSKMVGNELSSRFITMFYNDFDVVNPGSHWRLWALPLFFRGRDSHGESYTAVFPLVGRINEFLLFDKFTFLMFPLYLRTARQGEDTTDVLWPFISRTKGEGVMRARVFPFYGRAVREGKSESMFLMWPFLTWSSYTRGTERGGGFILFPFIGRTYGGDVKSWLVLPPFIRWTKGKHFSEAHLPWPFVQTSRGPVDKFYIWPLAGVKSQPGMKSGFLLWPFMWKWHSVMKNYTVDRYSILPFVEYENRTAHAEKDADGKPVLLGRTRKLWPLITSRRDGDSLRVRVPDLWPGNNLSQVDSSYGPLWTLFSRDDTKDSTDCEFLWGLIRSRRSPAGTARSIFPLVSWRKTPENGGTRELSFFLGLFGYRREGERSSVKILFMDFGGHRTGEEVGRETSKPLIGRTEH